MGDFLLTLAMVSMATSGSPATIEPHVARPLALVDGFVAAWNTHDGRLFSELFADDADWVTVGGARIKTRANIQSFLESEHATWARKTTINATGTEVRFPCTDVAVIHFTWEIRGAVEQGRGAANPSRGITLLVATKGPSGRWAIVAGQVSRQAPAK